MNIDCCLNANNVNTLYYVLLSIILNRARLYTYIIIFDFRERLWSV